MSIFKKKEIMPEYLSEKDPLVCYIEQCFRKDNSVIFVDTKSVAGSKYLKYNIVNNRNYYIWINKEKKEDDIITGRLNYEYHPVIEEINYIKPIKEQCFYHVCSDSVTYDKWLERYLRHQLKELLKEAESGKEFKVPLWIIIDDINIFKRISDINVHLNNLRKEVCTREIHILANM